MSESPTTGDAHDGEQVRRLYTLVSQFHLRDRPWPGRGVGLSGTDALTPGEPPPSNTVQLPPTANDYAPREPPEQQLPVQAVVDRLAPLEPTLVDIEVRNEAGTVIQILRYPEFGTYGPDPNDPGWFSEAVNPRTAVCAVLAPYAAVRCLAGVGYW